MAPYGPRFPHRPASCQPTMAALGSLELKEIYGGLEE